VVVDAGHGGSDLGAQGVSGVLEKDLALAVAKEVARDLRARGLEVVELRPDDRTVELHRRTELANASGAAAFVSLHANSDPSGKAQGVEVYSLDLASDAAAQRVATRENLAGFMAGETGPRAGDLDSVVMDLRLGARVEQSRSLATAVHQDMLSRLTAYYGPGVITDHGRRAAPFWVLADSDMPAILVEVGYLTHPDEERRLRTPGFQRLVGTAVGGAVADFLARAERVDAP
jgi:N-acetylmuramoyl-L-alanine amidase